MYRQINLASDPEVNIIDESSDDLIPGSVVLEDFFRICGIEPESDFELGGVPMHRTTRMTKVGPVHNLLPLETDSYPFGSLVIDGTALEINTKPMTTRNGVIQSVASAVNFISIILDTVNNAEGKQLRLTTEPTVMLTDEVLATLPKAAAVFGCDADVDVYNRVAQESMLDATKHNKRYAGGHVHMSFVEESKDKESWLGYLGKNFFDFVMLFDRTIGLATTVINQSVYESLRRRVYGQAGRARLQPYAGIEYRTPSATWVRDSSLTDYVFLWAQVANNLWFNEEVKLEIESLAPIDDIIHIINNGDSEYGLKLLKVTHDILKQVPDLTDDNAHQSDLVFEYAEFLYNVEGSERVFSDSNVASRWGKPGSYYPAYGSLNTVESFLYSV
jgi:hypothetical protein